MKILYVGHTYTVRANQAKIAALATAPCPHLKKEEESFAKDEPIEITLVTPHGWRGPLYANRADRFDRSLAENVDHHILRAFFIGKEGAYLFSPAIFSLIAKLKPDIVHVEQGTYALSYAQIILALQLFSPHSRVVFFTWWNLPYKLRGLKRIAERYNLSHSSCAIAGNEAARAILREHGFQKPIEVLPQLGIDKNLIVERDSAERDGKHFTIGYAGRITEEKGVLDLVRAVEQMQNVNDLILYMIGSGNALNEVRQAAAVQNVHFVHHPPVRNEELPEHLAKMDVLVLPSRTTPTWVEQFGHVLLEAMAAGVPVIGSSSGEIPKVISNAGLIFEEGNIAELSERLETLRSSNQECERLAKLGTARVRDHYSHEIIASAQMQLYRWMMLHGNPIGQRGIRSKPKNTVCQASRTTHE